MEVTNQTTALESVPRGGILMVAGEASADLHGAEVVDALRSTQPHLPIFGVGGEKMRRAGFEAVIDAEQMSVAGLTEVLLALPRMWRYMRQIERLAQERRPRVAVLIDLPDFNLRLAKRLKRLGIPVVYYISPQIWAWRQSRVHQIKELVDRMLVILPFEKDFYLQHNVPVDFVGHPLVEELSHSPSRLQAREILGLKNDAGPIVAMLPGSRLVEMTRLLPTMLASLPELRKSYPTMQVIVPVAATVPRDRVDEIVRQSGQVVTLIPGQATEVLVSADAVVVASGTATLQTALLARPMVVVYRVSWLTYHILKRMIKVAHIALVNLIAGKRLVTELVQNDFTPRALAAEVLSLLRDAAKRDALVSDLSALRSQLGKGDTAERVAAIVSTYLVARPALPQQRALDS
jgi:lipid-A-disaccharide synthase